MGKTVQKSVFMKAYMKTNLNFCMFQLLKEEKYIKNYMKGHKLTDEKDLKTVVKEFIYVKGVPILGNRMYNYKKASWQLVINPSLHNK